MEKKLTTKQYLKQHPEKYVMVGTYPDNPNDLNNFRTKGKICFVAQPILGGPFLGVATTMNVKDAEIWSSLDTTPTKLQWHIAKTGIKDLHFVEVIKLDQE